MLCYSKNKFNKTKGAMNFVDFYSQLYSEQKKKFFKAKKLNTLIEHGSFRYYSTYRTPSFRHDHWKEEIPRNLLDSIQNNSKICQKSMKLLNYSYFQAKHSSIDKMIN